MCIRDPFERLSRRLADFIQKVDRTLYQGLMDNLRWQMTQDSQMLTWSPETQCRIRFKGLVILKGGFHLKVNRNWVGTLSPGSENQTWSLPCSWAPERREVLVTLENSNLSVKSAIQDQRVEGVLEKSESEMPWSLTGIPARRGDGTVGFMKFP